MDAKKRKNQNEKNTPPALNYEDILDSFARDGDADPKSAESSRSDADGLALAELLGEEVPDIALSGHFDAIGASDYSELARQFDAIDLSELAGKDGETSGVDAGVSGEEETVPAVPSNGVVDLNPEGDELSLDEGDGYAALLDRLESEGKADLPAAVSPENKVSGQPPAEEEQTESDVVDWELLFEEEQEHAVAPAETPSQPEVLSIVNLAESMDSPRPEPAIEMSAPPLPEEIPGVVEDALDLSDLFAEETVQPGMETVESAALLAEEPEAALPMEAADTGMDFLGLTVIAPPENRAPEKTVRRMEVLFEGVEMNFEDQTDDVTLAELLLAQGKKKEAADILQGVSRKKGTTFWVAKRLRLLGASMEKQ